jgi:hypothetical protein
MNAHATKTGPPKTNKTCRFLASILGHPGTFVIHPHVKEFRRLI